MPLLLVVSVDRILQRYCYYETSPKQRILEVEACSRFVTTTDDSLTAVASAALHVRTACNPLARQFRQHNHPLGTRTEPEFESSRPLGAAYDNSPGFDQAAHEVAAGLSRGRTNMG